MINHITVRVSDFEKSQEFYSKTLEPLGYQCFKKNYENAHSAIAGYGTANKQGYSDFWIKKEESYKPVHTFSCLAFTAKSKEMVNGFFEAAIKAGGKDNGKPGYRPEYHAGYYAAFVLDPDGNNIEAVFDDPSTATS